MKKILPTMIGAVLAGGMTAAAADVTIFGHLDTAIVNKDVDVSTTPTNDGDDTNLKCTTCSIGFKGSEDLGNGLKAIFKLDFQFDMNNRNQASSGTNSILDRDQWIGFAGGFGKVRVGTISTVYKSHGAAIDPLYRTAVQGRNMGLQSDFHNGAGDELGARSTNTIRWDSVDFNGLKVGAFYTLDASEADGEDDDPFGIGASYENGGIMVFADYQDANGSTTTSNDVNAWKLGGKFSMDNLAVMAQYEDAEINNNDQTVWHIAGSATFGSNMLYVGYGQGESDPSVGTTNEYDAFTVAGTHSMSKRTMAYAAWSSADCDAGANSSSSSATASGHSVCAPVQTSGGDNTTIAVGLKHKF
jgi:predicted porin